MDPERPIEKLLRDYAKERREQAGTPELHPVTRRLLQSEVARQHPAPPEPRRSLSDRLLRWRPGWAVGLGVAAGLVLAALLVPSLTRTKTRGMFLAENQPATREALDRQGDLAGSRLDQRARRLVAPGASPAAAPAQPPAAVAAAERPGSKAGLGLEPSPTTTVAAGEATREQLAVGLLTTNGAVERLNLQAGRELAQAIRTTDLPAAAEGFKTPAQAKDRSYASTSAAVVDKLQRAELAAGQAKAEATLRAAPVEPAPATVTLGAAPPPSAGALPTLHSDSAVRLPSGALEEKAPALAWSDSAKNATSSSAPSRQRDLSGDNRAPDAGYFARALEAKKLPPATRYSQIPSTALLKQKGNKAATQLPVLVNFQVEQSGSALRIVDEDGSVYTGAVQLGQTVSGQAAAPATLADKTLQTEAEKNAVLNGLRPAEAQAPGGYSFQVAGTNRSLQQNVVFTGQIVPVITAQPNQPPSSAFGGLGGGAANSPGAPQQSLPLPLSASKIQGLLTIGKQQLPIDALPQP